MKILERKVGESEELREGQELLLRSGHIDGTVTFQTGTVTSRATGHCNKCPDGKGEKRKEDRLLLKKRGQTGGNMQGPRRVQSY